MNLFRNNNECSGPACCISRVSPDMRVSIYSELVDNVKLRYSTLRKAVASSHFELVHAILDIGVDLDACDRMGASVLHLACQLGNVAMVECLLLHEANVNHVDIGGDTAQYIAVQKNAWQLVDLLCRNGANVDLLKSNGFNVLHTAVRHKSQESVRVLQKYHVRVDVRGQNSKTALALAAGKGHLDIMRAILETRVLHMPDHTDKDGYNQLHLAAKHGHFDMICYLLGRIDCREYLNMPTALSSSTALFLAAQYGHADIVQCLLSKRADTTICSKQGNNALTISLISNKDEVVDILLQSHARTLLSQTYTANQAPLQLAITQGNRIATVNLQNHDADPYIRNDTNQTALMLAAMAGDHEITEALLLKQVQ